MIDMDEEVDKFEPNLQNVESKLIDFEFISLLKLKNFYYW